MASLGSAFHNVPAAPPPQGQQSNFDNPASRKKDLYITAGVCLSLIAFFTIGRVSAKITGVLAIRHVWHEVLFVMCSFSVAGFAGLSISLARENFLGYHQWDVRVSSLVLPALVQALLIQIFYPLILGFIKVMLIVYYNDIFKVNKGFRYGSYFGMAFIAGFSISTATAIAYLCRPVGDPSQVISWLIGQIATTRPSSRNLNIVQGVFGIVTDIYLMALPMPAIWGLQMPLKRKIGVSAMFMTGLGALAASTVGTYTRVQLHDSVDDTWNGVTTLCTALAEMTSGIMVMAAPATVAALRAAGVPLRSLVASASPSRRMSLPVVQKRRFAACDKPPERLGPFDNRNISKGTSKHCSIEKLGIKGSDQGTDVESYYVQESPIFLCHLSSHGNTYDGAAGLSRAWAEARDVEMGNVPPRDPHSITRRTTVEVSFGR